MKLSFTAPSQLFYSPIHIWTSLLQEHCLELRGKPAKASQWKGKHVRIETANRVGWNSICEAAAQVAMHGAFTWLPLSSSAPEEQGSSIH